ncbi:MAG: transposase [Acidobacteriota bacterium]
MARQARGGLAGVPHLVMQQVHEGQKLVQDDADRQRLLDTLRMAARDHGVAVHAYVLDDQEWWMLATPSTDEGLSLMVQSVGRQYVAHYNRRHRRRGSLWSARYKACVVASVHDLLDCMVLIESGRLDGTWSSAGHHLGRGVDPLLSEHVQFWSLGNTPFDREAAWKRRLEEGLSANRLAQLREAVSKGWAVGTPEDIARLQGQTERRLTPGKRGRPPLKRDI